MSKSSVIQTAINQASLTMNVAEDVARALKSAEIHPALAQVLMRFHHTQEQMDKEIKELRSTMLTLAQVTANGADVTAASLTAMNALCDRLGVDAAALFAPEPSHETTE